MGKVFIIYPLHHSPLRFKAVSSQRFFRSRLPALLALFCLFMLVMSQPVLAGVDPYINRYLRVTEPIALPLDTSGQTRLFTPEELSTGKQLFERNCLNCHVGGSTLPNPVVSLSLTALAGATPSRDTIAALVAYMRQPMSYDGNEDNVWCREVPPSWLNSQQVESLAGFILRAAQTAPGWGRETFQD